MFFICNQDGCSIPAETLLEQQSVPHPILVKNARSNLNPTPQNDKYAFFYTHFQPPPLSQDQNESYDQRGPKKKKQICHYPLLPQMTSMLSFIHIFNHQSPLPSTRAYWLCKKYWLLNLAYKVIQYSRGKKRNYY